MGVYVLSFDIEQEKEIWRTCLASSLRPATSWRPNLTALTSARPPRPRSPTPTTWRTQPSAPMSWGNRQLCQGLWHQTWRIQNPRRTAQIFGRQLFRLQSHTFPAQIGTAMTDCAAKRLSRRQNQIVTRIMKFGDELKLSVNARQSGCFDISMKLVDLPKIVLLTKRGTELEKSQNGVA